MDPGHNGEPGVLAAILVEEGHKLARAPVVQHQRVAKEAAPSHSFVGPQSAQVLAITIPCRRLKSYLPLAMLLFAFATCYMHEIARLNEQKTSTFEVQSPHQRAKLTFFFLSFHSKWRLVKLGTLGRL